MKTVFCSKPKWLSEKWNERKKLRMRSTLGIGSNYNDVLRGFRRLEKQVSNSLEKAHFYLQEFLLSSTLFFFTMSRLLGNIFLRWFWWKSIVQWLSLTRELKRLFDWAVKHFRNIFPALICTNQIGISNQLWDRTRTTYDVCSAHLKL